MEKLGLTLPVHFVCPYIRLDPRNRFESVDLKVSLTRDAARPPSRVEAIVRLYAHGQGRAETPAGGRHPPFFAAGAADRFQALCYFAVV